MSGYSTHPSIHIAGIAGFPHFGAWCRSLRLRHRRYRSPRIIDADGGTFCCADQVNTCFITLVRRGLPQHGCAAARSNILQTDSPVLVRISSISRIRGPRHLKMEMRPLGCQSQDEDLEKLPCAYMVRSKRSCAIISSVKKKDALTKIQDALAAGNVTSLSCFGRHDQTSG